MSDPNGQQHRSLAESMPPHLAQRLEREAEANPGHNLTAGQLQASLNAAQGRHDAHERAIQDAARAEVERAMDAAASVRMGENPHGHSNQDGNVSTEEMERRLREKQSSVQSQESELQALEARLAAAEARRVELEARAARQGQ